MNVARNRTRCALTLVLVVLGAVGLAYVIAARRPFAADRAPGRVETAIARRLVSLSIPPDLASPAIPQFSDGALSSIIHNGVRWTGMPAFRATDDPAEMWKLVSFVRHVPTLNAADLAHHDGEAGGGVAATTVSMDGTTFQPAEVTVRAGDVVEWINRDPFPHNVSADAAAIHSGDLDADGKWRYRAVTPGTFHYVCTLHPGMAGVLHVQ
jgi:plastocyanin